MDNTSFCARCSAPQLSSRPRVRHARALGATLFVLVFSLLGNVAEARTYYDDDDSLYGQPPRYTSTRSRAGPWPHAHPYPHARRPAVGRNAYDSGSRYAPMPGRTAAPRASLAEVEVEDITAPPVSPAPAAPASRWPHAPVKKVLPPKGTAEHNSAAGHSEPVEVIESADVEVAADKEGPSTWWGDAWPVWDRVIDAHTPRTTRKHKFNTLIVHRNYGGFGTQPFHSLLGFDQGLLKVGLGVRFGIFNWLDVGLLRVNGTIEAFNTYEFDFKGYALNQERFGIDLGARIGLSWFEQYHHSDAVGVFVQLLMGRLFFNRLYAGASLLFHSSSSGPKKASTDSSESTAVQLYVDGRIFPGLSFAMELTPTIAGYSLCNPIFTMGPRFITNRHTFTIALSNSQYFDADGIVAGTDRTRFDNWMLGFNITRELG